MGKFNFNDTPVAKVAEEIRDNDSVNVEENSKAVANTSAPTQEAAPATTEQPEQENASAESENEEKPKAPARKKSSASTSLQASKAKKSKNGIVIDVPIDDYLEMMRLKVITGKTLKDLALQAVHEFIERNK